MSQLVSKSLGGFELERTVGMDLMSTINPNNISLHLECSDREAVLQEMTHWLLQSQAITNEADFLDDVEYREMLGMTGIGNEVAVPHGSQAVAYPTVAIATLQTPIAWKSIDDAPVRLVLLFAEPDELASDQGHSTLLTKMIQKLSNDETLYAVKQATTVDEIVNLLKE